jgi:hypothetical protein
LTTSFNVRGELIRVAIRQRGIEFSRHTPLEPGKSARNVVGHMDDVMIDNIIQRAVNLTWNRPTQEGTGDDEVLLDV